MAERELIVKGRRVEITDGAYANKEGTVFWIGTCKKGFYQGQIRIGIVTDDSHKFFVKESEVMLMSQTNKTDVVKHLVEGDTLKGNIRWWIEKPDRPESINKSTIKGLFEEGFLEEVDVGEEKFFLREARIKPEKMKEAKEFIAKKMLEGL